MADFNPRSHKGSDNSWVPEVMTYRPISIHAPTRGATLHVDCEYPGILYFNPRSHKGSDDAKVVNILRTVISIHAPTRGATLTSRPPIMSTWNFNPRSHKGSDEHERGMIMDEI